jgi:hypothetical protein
MTAIGFALFAIGVLCANLFPPVKYAWTPRDFFGVLPFAVGALLMFAGAVTWLWQNAP